MKDKSVTNLNTSMLAIMSFAINMVIGFWSSPFIVDRLGTEAYGFSNLGGNFTTYMSLFTVAVNSFAARYITIALQNKENKKASKYFTTVLFTNMVMILIMLTPIAIVIFCIKELFDVPAHLVFEVQIQWGILFAAWIVDLLFKVYSTATFAKNRLDINYRLTAISNIIRFAVIFILFSFFSAHLWYIGIAGLLANLFIDIGYYRSQKQLMPEVTIRYEYFDWSCLRELVIKGVWNSLNQLAAILINGLNLLLTNIFINPLAMGFYSIAQMIPNYMQSLMYTLCDVFKPQLTISYAKGRVDEVCDGLKYQMRFNSMLLMVPMLGFFVYGLDFYTLWQYALDAKDVKQIQTLSMLVLLPMISGVIIQPLLTINSITTKLKVPVFINIGIGLLSFGMDYLLVHFTDLGVFAIAGVSGVMILLRNYLFYPIYGAAALKLPIKTFYPAILFNSICELILFAYLYLTHMFLSIKSWGELIVYAGIFGLTGEILAMFLLLKKEERKAIIGKVLRKLKK